jgi:hypothetical protein
MYLTLLTMHVVFVHLDRHSYKRDGSCCKYTIAHSLYQLHRLIHLLIQCRTRPRKSTLLQTLTRAIFLERLL